MAQIWLWVNQIEYIYITVLEGSTDIQNSCNNKVNQTVLVQIFNYNFLIIL